MADREREPAGARDEAGTGGGAGSGVATGVLFATVACILVAGLALRSAPHEPAPRAPQARPAPAERTEPQPLPPKPVPVEERPAPATAPPPAPAEEDLSRRASEDGARLRRSSGKFTAQILVACSAENVRRLLRGERGGSLYVLSAPERGDGCYRICWGSYGTSRLASEAADLPAPLRPPGGGPLPKKIDEVLR